MESIYLDLSKESNGHTYSHTARGVISCSDNPLRIDRSFVVKSGLFYTFDIVGLVTRGVPQTPFVVTRHHTTHTRPQPASRARGSKPGAQAPKLRPRRTACVGSASINEIPLNLAVFRRVSCACSCRHAHLFSRAGVPRAPEIRSRSRSHYRVSRLSSSQRVPVTRLYYII